VQIAPSMRARPIGSWSCASVERRAGMRRDDEQLEPVSMATVIGIAIIAMLAVQVIYAVDWNCALMGACSQGGVISDLALDTGSAG
jgi:hypothetical protein